MASHGTASICIACRTGRTSKKFSGTFRFELQIKLLAVQRSGDFLEMLDGGIQLYQSLV